MSLAFFTINQDGDEIPLGDGKITSTQDYIEKTIKMNYKTFTASSMILQWTGTTPFLLLRVEFQFPVLELPG